MVLKKEHKHRETGVVETEQNICSFRKEHQVNKQMDMCQQVEERKKGLMPICMHEM